MRTRLSGDSTLENRGNPLFSAFFSQNGEFKSKGFRFPCVLSVGFRAMWRPATVNISGLVLRDQIRRAQARERRRSSLERLDAARAAMAQRKDVQPEWVITTFGNLVDGLKTATTSPDTSPIAPRSASSDPGPQVNIGILQRLGFVLTGKMLGDQLGWSEAWVPEPGRRLFFIIDLRDRRRPCAVLLVCDPGPQAHQLFALKRIKGRFGRQEYCFICPHTGRQSTVIFYSEGQFFCST